MIAETLAEVWIGDGGAAIVVLGSANDVVTFGGGKLVLEGDAGESGEPGEESSPLSSDEFCS